MVKVYGVSDDLVEIEGSKYKEDEIDCYDAVVRLCFSDGTKIRVGYPKSGVGVWWIAIDEKGTADMRFSSCEDEDAEAYSDVLEIDAEVVSH